MAVTVAGVVQSLRTGTTDPMTWSHNTGTTAPKGVVVMLIHGTSSTDHTVSVTYGTRSLTRVQRNTDTATEPGVAEIWFAGGGIPTGTQTVTADLSSGTTDDILGVSITLDAAFNLVKIANGGRSENAANPSVTLTNATGNSAMAFAAFYSGLTDNTSITAGTNCTLFTSTDLAGNFTSCGIRQTTASTSDFTIAATSATDDVAFAAASFGESTVSCNSGTYTLTGTAANLRLAIPRSIVAAGGLYTVTGTAVAIGPSIPITGGVYTITGSTVALTKSAGNPVLTCSNGTYTVTGSTVAGLATRTIAIQSGTLTVTGTSVGLPIRCVGLGGAYTLTGVEATLIYSPVGAWAISAESGAYVVSGTVANMLRASQLVAIGGSYVVTGVGITGLHAHVIQSGAGAYVLSGTLVTLGASGTETIRPLLAMMGFGR